MRTWVKICVVFIVALSPSIGVVRNARLHAPVQEGTPTEFWQLACGVNVTGAGEQKVLGGMYPPKGDWAIYYVLGYHDQFLHRVRLSEIAPFMPEVISLLQAEQQQGDLHPVFQRVLESGMHICLGRNVCLTNDGTARILIGLRSHSNRFGLADSLPLPASRGFAIRDVLDGQSTWGWYRHFCSCRTSSGMCRTCSHRLFRPEAFFTLTSCSGFGDYLGQAWIPGYCNLLRNSLNP
jgi:hypothetical protein